MYQYKLDCREVFYSLHFWLELTGIELIGLDGLKLEVSSFNKDLFIDCYIVNIPIIYYFVIGLIPNNKKNLSSSSSIADLYINVKMKAFT